MQKFEKVIIEKEKLASIVCDVCGREIARDDYNEIQEVLSVERYGGFGSVFGDGVLIRLDMCQHCMKEKLGEFIRIEDNEF